MLLDSYTFALLSIQTPVPIHEDAWQQYMNGVEPRNAFEKLNYRFNKEKYLNYTKGLSLYIFEDILTEFSPNHLHKKILDNFKGVGTIKSSFTMSMLGFTSKICIDANLINYFGLNREDIYTGKVVKKYEKQCSKLMEEINLNITPFMKQWVIFNYQRMSENDRGFAKHTTYFNEMLGKY